MLALPQPSRCSKLPKKRFLPRTFPPPPPPAQPSPRPHRRAKCCGRSSPTRRRAEGRSRGAEPRSLARPRGSSWRAGGACSSCSPHRSQRRFSVGKVPGHLPSALEWPQRSGTLTLHARPGHRKRAATTCPLSVKASPSGKCPATWRAQHDPKTGKREKERRGRRGRRRPAGSVRAPPRGRSPAPRRFFPSASVARHR